MADRYSVEDREELLKIYFSGKSLRETVIEFQNRYPGREKYPSFQAVSKLIKKFNQTGSVQNKKKTQPNTVLTESNVINFLANVQGNPIKGIKKRASECGFSYTSGRKILKTLYKFHPYKLQKVQALYGNNK